MRSSVILVTSVLLLTGIKALNVPHDNTILFYLYQQYWVANPISGQNFPPPELPILQYFQGIADIDINCALWVEHISVNESTHSFDARYWWAMNYEDERIAPIITYTNYTSDCATLCSTHAGLVLNEYGDNACCTDIYMPNSYFQNIIGGSLQNQPNEWVVFPIPGTNRAQYWARGTSKFSVNFDYSAFPFDKQRLEFRIMTEFMPILDGNNSIQLMSPSVVIPALSSYRIAPDALQDFEIRGWKVASKSAYATAFEQRSPFADSSQGLERWQPGVVFAIEIERKTTGFWFQILVLPILLLIAFSFFSFKLEVEYVKSRMSLLSAMFLAILLLQFTIRGYLPGNASIMPPYIILVISYIYLIVMGLVFLVIHTIHEFYTTNDGSIRLLRAKKAQLEFERHQLLVCGGENGMPLEAATLASDKQMEHSIAHQLRENERKARIIEDRIHELSGPWYKAKEGVACGSLCSLLLHEKSTAELAKWFACIAKPQAKDYCHWMARSLEKWLVCIMMLTYALATFLVYIVPYMMS